MHRNRLILFLAIGLSIFLCLPVLNITMRAVTGVDPVIPDDVEEFWATDSAEGIAALALWSCCDHSLRPGEAIIGQDGYLFLGNDYSSIIDKTTGSFQLASKRIEAWADGLENLANYVESIDASFVFVLVPNKHSIYPDQLPENVVPASETVTDLLFESAARRDLPVLDLRQPLQDLRSETQVYMLTDTHWTPSAAALAYAQTISFVNEKRDFNLHPLNFEQTESHKPSGDLAAFLKVQPFLSADHEKLYITTVDSNSFCISQLDLSGMPAQPCEVKSSGAIDVRADETFFTKSEVEGAPNEQTVVMICDSFCFAHSELFNASFKTVYRIHWQKLQGMRLKVWLPHLDPDLVIFQIVERNMLNPVMTFN